MINRKKIGVLAGLPLIFFSLHGHADGTGKWANGEETYNKVCGYCHEVGVGPYLLGRQFPAAVIEYMARNGSRAMPAMKPSFIDDAALKNVAEFIEKSKAGPNAPKSSITDPEIKESRIANNTNGVPIIAATTLTRNEE
jgi:mono/diheme cytochrome c family protein